jgi:hypothetical protein
MTEIVTVATNDVSIFFAHFCKYKMLLWTRFGWLAIRLFGWKSISFLGLLLQNTVKFRNDTLYNTFLKETSTGLK